MNDAIEGAIATAIENGMLHEMARDALESAIYDESFLTKLGEAFLRHPNTQVALTKFTYTVVERTMDDILDGRVEETAVHTHTAADTGAGAGPSKMPGTIAAAQVAESRPWGLIENVEAAPEPPSDPSSSSSDESYERSGRDGKRRK